jgi:eukaryotic-like serine/threonine-protein kinase
VLRAGQPVSLTPKALDLLVYLVERHGHLVAKQELLSAVWPDTFVEEANLTYNISALRKALGDGQDGEQFIQTVPTRGYRFVAPVARDDDEPGAARPERIAAPGRHLLRRGIVIALAIALVTMLPVVVRHLRETPVTPQPVRFTIPLPDSAATSSAIVTPQISPDGRRLAFIVAHASPVWLHDLDGEGTRPLPGTEDARGLFWSPDSEHLAFSTSSALKKIRLTDGIIQTLCDSCRPAGGGAWSRNGQILFPTLDGPLLGISAAGGAPEAITSLDQSAGETAHLAPCFCRTGSDSLYVIRNADEARSGIYVGQVGSDSRRLLQGDGPALYAAPGYLLFLRSRTLMAQRFDPVRLQLTGEGTPLVDAVFPAYSLTGQPGLSISDTGVLTYAILDRPVGQFQWVDRAGNLQEAVGDPGMYYTFDLSPDGRRIVYAQSDERGHLRLRVFDTERSVVSSPLTPGDSGYADPRWVNSQQIVATRWRPSPHAIVQIGLDGVEFTLTSSATVANMVDAVSRDGRFLLFRPGGHALLAAPLGEASESVVVRESPTGTINQAQFSPNSRWIAYQEADDSGQYDVYVTPFPSSGERWQVSSGGGVQPMWREDGREMYYLGMDGTLNVVEFRPGTPPRFSPPRRLFATGLLPPSTTVEEYAADQHGQRFLVLKPLSKARSSIGVLLNWTARLPDR